MINNCRNQIVLFLISILTGCSVLAQDTSKMDSRSMMSSNNSSANEMTFSSKPFSGTKGFKKFSVGLNAGVFTPNLVIGGSNDFTKWDVALGYGANIKYQLTHLLALQVEGFRGTLKGHQKDFLYTGGPSTRNYPIKFETDINYAWDVSAVYTFGSINWLRPITKVVPYLAAGGGLTGYKPKIQRAGTSNLVDYRGDNKSITEFFVPVTFGMKFNLSPSVNLDLGYKMNFVDDNNLDGDRSSDFKGHKDRFAYTFAGIEFALGGKGKPQLMFDNPAYRSQAGLQYQIDSLKNSIRTVDSDGDGVIDQLDQCPNTPAGVAVNTHGCPIDTDGDGVPDYKDKELVTPTFCQPVDADGVGKCPPPACCTDMVKKDDNANACNIGDLPSISFKGNMGSLSSDAKAMLATVASKLKGGATCSITVTGYPAASKASQAVCNRRTSAVKSYLIEKEGISADRIMVNCEVGTGDANTVDIKVNK